MADQPMQPLHLRSDDDLGGLLTALGDEIAWPRAVSVAGGPDIAAVVAARLVAAADAAPLDRSLDRTPSPERGSWLGRTWPRWTWRPATRALVIALIVLLALAALAGASGLGLPGLRIIFGAPEPTPTASPVPSPVPSPSEAIASPTPTPGPPGSSLGLGTNVDPSAVDGLAGFHVPRPPIAAVGEPDAAWVDATRNDQVALVWAASERLPETNTPGVGLVEMAFRGRIDEGWFKKIVGPGTKVETVEVNGHRGFWISGQAHEFFYEGPNGFVEESRRWVGNALMWSDGPITYRLETALGPVEAVTLAESMR